MACGPRQEIFLPQAQKIGAGIPAQPVEFHSHSYEDRWPGGLSVFIEAGNDRPADDLLQTAGLDPRHDWPPWSKRAAHKTIEGVFK